MWYLIASCLVILTFSQYGSGVVDAEEDIEPSIVYRPGTGSICPRRAVCADVWDYRQTIDGQTNIMRRKIYNCRCNRNSHEVCPTDNDAHMLHASAIQKQYLCQAVSTFPVCNASKPFQVAEEMEDKSPEFNYRNFYKIDCICPRHSAPLPQVEGLLLRATTYYRTQMNFGQGRPIFIQHNICST